MHCTRRQFIGAGTLGGITLATGQLGAASGEPETTAASKVRIAAILAGKTTDRSWCLPEEELDSLVKRLALAEKNLGNVEFVIGQATNAEETNQLLDKAGPDAPVLVITTDIFSLSNFNKADAVMPAIFAQGRPAAVFHIP